VQTNISVGISIPQEILKKIDAKRGDIPRSKFVLRMLEKVYVLDEKVKLNENYIVVKEKEDSPDRRVESLQSSESVNP
jgi:metal-responsive CopG/Arc/MetJ family transcriptional regulator